MLNIVFLFKTNFSITICNMPLNVSEFYMIRIDLLNIVSMSGLVSSVRRALASMLRGPGFKSRSGRVGGPVTMINKVTFLCFALLCM